jgi:hypothetical protein
MLNNELYLGASLNWSIGAVEYWSSGVLEQWSIGAVGLEENKRIIFSAFTTHDFSASTLHLNVINQVPPKIL